MSLEKQFNYSELSFIHSEIVSIRCIVTLHVNDLPIFIRSVLQLRLFSPSSLSYNTGDILLLLLSTLIRYEQGDFRSRSWNWRNYKTSDLRFKVEEKQF